MPVWSGQETAALELAERIKTAAPQKPVSLCQSSRSTTAIGRKCAVAGLGRERPGINDCLRPAANGCVAQDRTVARRDAAPAPRLASIALLSIGTDAIWRLGGATSQTDVRLRSATQGADGVK